MITMKEIGRKTKEKERELVITKMVKNMMDNGNKIKDKEKEFFTLAMVNMKEIGRMAKEKEKQFYIGTMEINMKEFIKTIKEKVKEFVFLKTALNARFIIKMIKRSREFVPGYLIKIYAKRIEQNTSSKKYRRMNICIDSCSSFINNLFHHSKTKYYFELQL